MKHAITLTFLATIHVSLAANETSPPPQKESASKSPWSVAAGMRAREFRSNFSVGALAPSGFSLNNNTALANGGNGDVGFFTGGAGAVTYADGSVGPAYGTQPGNFGPDGSAYGTINSESQLVFSGRNDSGGDPIFDLNFHSSTTGGQSSSGYKPGGFNSADESTVISPYLEIRYHILDHGRWSLDALAGYSFAQTGLHSGMGSLGTASNANSLTTTTYTYTYDHYAVNSGAIGANYPFQDTQSATIFDAAVANAPNGYTQNTNDSIAPRKNATQATGASNGNQTYFAQGFANLDVNLHEIVFAAELVFRVKEKLHITVSAGPTVNVLDTNLSTTSVWYSGQKKLSETSARTRRTDVEIGVMGQLGLRYNLTPRWFIQVDGGYRYVPDVSITAGNATARLDASSWSGGVGVGFGF